MPELKMTWWSVTVYCPKCQKEAPLQTGCFSADGELLYVAYCFDCKETVQYRCFASTLFRQAFLNDLDKARKVQPLKERKPLTPPLEEDHKKDDDDFLKSQGIDPAA